MIWFNIKLLYVWAILIFPTQGYAIENLKALNLNSGISKTYSEPFLLKKANVVDITTEFVKAANLLHGKSQFYFYVHRDDDRYLRVQSVDELFSDPNSKTSPIDYMSWNLWDLTKKEYQQGDKPRRIGYLNFDNNKKGKIEITVSGDDMSWSLLLADKLESQVKRVIINDLNLTRIITVFISIPLYILISLFLLRLAHRTDFKKSEHNTFITLLITIPIYVAPMVVIIPLVKDYKEVVNWFYYSPSFFMWGDMRDVYVSTSGTENRLLWGVFIALIVSVIANYFSAKQFNRSNQKPESVNL